MLKRVALTRRRRAPRSPQEPCARRRANACWGVRFLEKSKHARPESVGAPQSFARRAPGVSGERSDDVLVRAYRGMRCFTYFSRHGPHHFTSRYAGDRQCGRTGSGRGAGERICGAAAGVSWYVFARFRWLRQGSLEPRATSLIALIASRPSAPYVSRPGPARPCGQRTRGARWTRVYCLLTVLGVSQRANSLTVARFVVFSLGAGFRVSKWFRL